MRKDNKIHDVIMGGREKEKETGCCIRNDGSGCIQTLKEHCSVSIKFYSLFIMRFKNNHIFIINIAPAFDLVKMEQQFIANW